MRVVNKHREAFTVYIGRPSVLGNPFVIGKDGDRAEVVRKFEIHARSSVAVMQAIKQLKATDVLGCFCSPAACHGDVIMKIWKEQHTSVLDG